MWNLVQVYSLRESRLHRPFSSCTSLLFERVPSSPTILISISARTLFLEQCLGYPYTNHVKASICLSVSWERVHVSPSCLCVKKKNVNPYNPFSLLDKLMVLMVPECLMVFKISLQFLQGLQLAFPFECTCAILPRVNLVAEKC